MNLAWFFTMGPGQGSPVADAPLIGLPGGGRVPEQRVKLPLKRLRRRLHEDVEIEADSVLAFIELNGSESILTDAQFETVGSAADSALGSPEISAAASMRVASLALVLAEIRVAAVAEAMVRALGIAGLVEAGPVAVDAAASALIEAYRLNAETGDPDVQTAQNPSDEELIVMMASIFGRR